MAKSDDKPVLDEQTLGKLLEAAYVLQEHNRELQKVERSLELKRDQLEAEEKSVATAPQKAPQGQSAPPPPKTDYSFTLAQIVETQRQIQLRHLDLENAVSLVAGRLLELARAGGAAIGLLHGNSFRCLAAAGQMTVPLGTEVPMEKALCVACLRTGQVMRCADVKPEFLVDAEECQRRGIAALIAVPVYHNGEIAGGLELYYDRAHAFTEHDVHTCQLMAGLVTEALTRNEEATSKKSLASERALMMDALEKLKPSLTALMDIPAARPPTAKVPNQEMASPTTSHICHRCGHKLVGEEQFCGKCGSPRTGHYEVPGLPAEVASLLQMPEATKHKPPANSTNGKLPHEALPASQDHVLSTDALDGSFKDELPELLAELELPIEATAHSAISEAKPISTTPASTEEPEVALSEPKSPTKPDLAISLQAKPAEEDSPPETTALAKVEPNVDWTSAANARQFLEHLALSERHGALIRFWNSRRGDIYLALAVILVACVIRWGIWSSHSVGATGKPSAATAAHSKPAPDADLSLFDRILIDLGLAEAPPPPENKGNPDTQVWVDLHSALYYCPGADLYGKTPQGKFTTQREAQLDQFEPAYRKTCD